VDFSNGLTTSIESHMGTSYYGNETTYRAIFGVVDMEGLEAPLYTRHTHTDELIGHAFASQPRLRVRLAWLFAVRTRQLPFQPGAGVGPVAFDGA